MPHNVCGDIEPKSGVRCTKKPGHFPRTQHSNEKPGHSVWWGDVSGNQKEKSA